MRVDVIDILGEMPARFKRDRHAPEGAVAVGAGAVM